MNTGIVWNPSKVDEAELRAAFEEAARPIGAAAEWFETTEDDPGGNASGRALEAGCELVIAAGGDGTVRAVAERLGASGSPAADLGIVPLGTGNLLARNLEVPLGDLRAAFSRALTGRAFPLDLGEVRFRRAEGADESTACFAVMIGFGVDAQMIVETDDELKARAGRLAYVESLGRAFSGADPVDLRMTLDRETREVRAHTVLVGNCGTLQGGIPLLPDAEPDDGELDLLVLSADDAGSWLDTMKNVVWDNGLRRLVAGAVDARAESSESTRRLRAKRGRIDLSEPRTLEIDGDDVGEVSEFDIRVLPGALRVR